MILPGTNSCNFDLNETIKVAVRNVMSQILEEPNKQNPNKSVAAT